MAEESPNILVIYLDQCRYDAIGANGNNIIKTPNLDRLAGDGARFKNAFTTYPLCVPSRVGFFTGRYNHSNLSDCNEKPIFPGETDFIYTLRQFGYYTALCGKDHLFEDYKRKEITFDHIKEVSHNGFLQPENEKERAVNEFREGKITQPFNVDTVPDSENLSAILVDDAISVLSEKRDKPVFLWLSIPDPHPPYLCPESCAELYRDADVPPPLWREGEMDNKPYRQKLAVEWNRYDADYPKPGDIRRHKELYWGSVTYIDSQIGRLLDFLRDAGIDENTVVVFTSDHGDYQGDHRMIRKGPHLYDALTHVPLFVRWKGHILPQVIDSMAENIDVMPTVFRLCGLPLSDAVQGKPFDGLLMGKTDFHRDYAFCEYGIDGRPIKPGDLSPEKYNELKNHFHHHLSTEVITGKTRGIRTREWKYLRTPGDAEELYDLKNDPGELYNLADCSEHTAVKARLAGLLLDALIATENRG